MNEPMVMREFQSARGLQRVRRRPRRLEFSVLAEQFREGVALNVLHREKMDAAIDAEIVNLDDVWMLQPRGGVSFAGKTDEQLRIGGEGFVECFEGNQSAQGYAGVGQINRSPWRSGGRGVF